MRGVPPVTPAGHKTRDALLDAGVRVAERAGLGGLSVNAVVAEAGVAKGTFYVHFADRAAFIDAMHERFHVAVRTAVTDATDGLDPGAQLLIRAAETYLDACLADRAVKALVTEARANPALSGPMAERASGFAAQAEPSLRALGRKDAKAAARLLQAMVSEAAMMELEAGKRLPAVRRSLRDWIAP